MLKNPPAVGVVKIHIDPESVDTSFGGITVSTFQGAATLITLAGPFRKEGLAGTFFRKSSAPRRI